MRVGVPREVKPGENRVALTPHGVEALKGAGDDVRVQAGGGEERGFPGPDTWAGGGLPLLRRMSEVAGILAVQVGARALEKSCGGRGVLLSGVGGAAPARVVVIGAGNAGRSAARTAAGVGAD